ARRLERHTVVRASPIVSELICLTRRGSGEGFDGEPIVRISLRERARTSVPSPARGIRKRLACALLEPTTRPLHSAFTTRKRPPRRFHVTSESNSGSRHYQAMGYRAGRMPSPSQRLGRWPEPGLASDRLYGFQRTELARKDPLEDLLRGLRKEQLGLPLSGRARQPLLKVGLPR